MKIETDVLVAQAQGDSSEFVLRVSDAKGRSEHRVSHPDALGACLAFFMSGQGRAFVARHSLTPQVLFDNLPAQFEHRALVTGPGFTIEIERVQ